MYRLYTLQQTAREESKFIFVFHLNIDQNFIVSLFFSTLSFRFGDGVNSNIVDNVLFTRVKFDQREFLSVDDFRSALSS